MKERRIKVIVLPANGPAEIREIDNTLEAMQALVGGYVEHVEIRGLHFWCNEDGKASGLPYNRTLPEEAGALPGDYFVGDVLVTGMTDDGDCASVKPDDLSEVRRLFGEEDEHGPRS